MTLVAIIFMIISMVTIWGGLGLALYNLSRHPEKMDDEIELPSESAR